MKPSTKETLLKTTLIVTGLVSILLIPIAKVWPSGFVWHGGEGAYYFQMIAGIYATMGGYMLYAAINPFEPRHRTFLFFVVVVNIVHAVIMGFQAAGDHSERGHLIGDVPLLFISSVLIWYLMPARKPESANDAHAGQIASPP